MWDFFFFHVEEVEKKNSKKGCGLAHVGGKSFDLVNFFVVAVVVTRFYGFSNNPDMIGKSDLVLLLKLQNTTYSDGYQKLYVCVF